MRLDQGEVFAGSEGDRWFARNHQALDRFDPAADPPLRALELYDLKPRKVLEIGAANGFRLAEIYRRHGAKIVAVEPSMDALRDGAGRFPAVEFVRGQAHAIPLEEQFDLVIVNFVLHWVDRSRLLRSVAEIDRLLADGGFLIIGDFYPANQVRVRYHHLPDEEVFTYKQNYAGSFLAAGIYRPIGLLTGRHGAKAANGAGREQERTGLWLLQKCLQEQYAESSGPGR